MSAAYGIQDPFLSPHFNRVRGIFAMKQTIKAFPPDGRRKSSQSAEASVANLANGWLKEYGLKFFLENEDTGTAIDGALQEYVSKSGGKGGNRPDAKIISENPDDMKHYPVLIEYKGYKDKLVKLDGQGQIENQNAQKEPNYKNIKNYAVNGAVHYANALLHYTTYDEVFAVGMAGWRDETMELRHKIEVWYVAKSNFGLGQKVGEYEDLSFLKPQNIGGVVAKAKELSLTEEELNLMKQRREEEIAASLIKINNDIYKNEKLGSDTRIYLIVASIIATLGVPGKVVPLKKSDLTSSREKGNTDGEIMMRKVKNFLAERNLPEGKNKLICNTLENTLTDTNINEIVNGETQLKRVFSKIYDDLGIYYKIGLTTDFTGMLFNEIYNWLGFSQDKMNDVVLTPPYVAKLLVKLARTDKDSYVWDNAAGSAGLLVAAMNEMIKDAREKSQSPDKLWQKEADIRGKQLLGIEILPNIYMLAVLNMILMGDGSSHILNVNSLTKYDGKYEEGQREVPFPATVFVLNPPYSADGCGMVFVKSALSKMERGFAAVIIQSSAGSGKAAGYNVEILKRNTLETSIKMPADLFLGKSSVQTCVYVFRVGVPHDKRTMVKFIDFSNDGYTRSNRKKARVNIKDSDHAAERYAEVVNVAIYGKAYLHHLTENEYYEERIDPENGADWNFTARTNLRTELKDFQKTVSDYLAWEVSNIIKRNAEGKSVGKTLPHSKKN